jgi:hypothetical protein
MSVDDMEPRAILQEEASAEGEHLLWWGRPSAGRLALQALPASIFGIPFTAFAVFWMWGAAGGLSGERGASGPGLLFPLFGLPFVAVGLGLLLSPLLALWTARRTLYAVTSGRVLVVRVGRSRKVDRHPLPDERLLSRTQRPDGSGDLVVAKSEVATNRGRTALRTVTFVGIPEVARVERIVADAHRSRADRPGPAAPPPPAWPPSASIPARGATEGRLPALLLILIGAVLGGAVAVLATRSGRLPIALPPASRSAALRPLPAAQPDGTAQASPPLPMPSAEDGCAAGEGAACAQAARASYERMGAQDRARGASLASRGCDLGHAGACLYFAWIVDGNGGTELTDPAAASRALARACELGSGDACRRAAARR